MDYRNFQSNVPIRRKKSDGLGVKKKAYWYFFEVDNCIYPILHNQINLGNIFFITY